MTTEENLTNVQNDSIPFAPVRVLGVSAPHSIRHSGAARLAALQDNEIGVPGWRVRIPMK